MIVSLFQNYSITLFLQGQRGFLLFLMVNQGLSRRTTELTCRQHCGAMSLKKPSALMRGRAFQKSPSCWRLGEVTCSVLVVKEAHIFQFLTAIGLCVAKYSIFSKPLQ